MLDEQGAEYTERATETGIEILADGFLFVFDSYGNRVYAIVGKNEQR